MSARNLLSLQGLCSVSSGLIRHHSDREALREKCDNHNFKEIKVKVSIFGGKIKSPTVNSQLRFSFGKNKSNSEVRIWGKLKLE